MPTDVPIVAGLSGVRCDARLPLAVGAARAIAVDGADAARLAWAVHATRAGGRIVAPASASVPDGVRELVRDASVWVGEREAPPYDLAGLPLLYEDARFRVYHMER